MANLFTFFDNGTWETTPVDTATQNPAFIPHPFTLSSDFSFAGTKSGKAQAANTSRSLLAMLCCDQYHSYVPRSITFIAGKKYKVKCRVYTPSAFPIGTDNMPVLIGPDQFTNSSCVFDFCTVADCKDTWVEISLEFIYPGPPSSEFSEISVYGFKGSGLLLIGPPRNGSLHSGGKLYIDNISVDEVVNCTIGYNNPAYNKTDETALDADDGTITVHAHTTFPPLQYRVDGGAYQLSNVFTGLIPGFHTVEVIDDTICELGSLNVQIIAYQAPPPPTGGTLIISEKPLNNYNFVSWFETTSGDTGFDKVDCINHHWDLPRPYDEIRNKKVHAFVVAQNEQFTFYINFDTPLPLSLDFSQLRLGLARNNGMVNMNLAQLHKDANDDGTYNLYASATINTTVPSGENYFLVIYRIDSFDILYSSGRLEVMLKDDADTFTARLQYRHSNNFYNYYFARLNNLLLQVRMRMANIDEQTESAIQQYRAVSSGQLRNVSFDLDKYIKLETYYYDIYGIRGMYSFQAMETIIINDKNYILKTAYKTAWSSKGLNVHKGSIELFEQEFSTQNKYGNPSTITIVGSDDSLLQADNGYLIKI